MAAGFVWRHDSRWQLVGVAKIGGVLDFVMGCFCGFACSWDLKRMFLLFFLCQLCIWLGRWARWCCVVFGDCCSIVLTWCVG